MMAYSGPTAVPDKDLETWRAWGHHYGRATMKLELRRDGSEPPVLENSPQILDRPSLTSELFWMLMSVLAGLLIFLCFLVL
jgi:hypothetical protein